MDSTNSRQSIAPRNRRLPMLLLIETWSAACCWLPYWINWIMVWFDSERRCSIHVSGNAKAGLCPCKRLTNSETNGVDIGGFDLAISAITRIRLFGSCSAILVILSAQESARSLSTLPAATLTAIRRRFSIRANRNIMGIAHNSPSFKVVTVWYAVTKRRRFSGSTWPSPWDIISFAIS